MSARLNLVAAAFALTALAYGLARFAYGLLLPRIRDDLGLSPSTAGWIGGSAFAAYCIGIVLAFLLGGRLGPRRVAMLAGLTATIGMALVSVASSGWVLGLAITLTGLSTGLTSPPLAAAVTQAFGERDRPRANGTINAGTAAGIVFSGLATLATDGAWRELYAVFAGLGGIVTLWLRFALPAGPAESGSAGLQLTVLKRPGLAGLAAGAFLMGLSSTAIWTFGADILRGDLAFSGTQVALAWIALGSAGTLGAATGLLTARFGVGRVHRLALLGTVLGEIGLAVGSAASPSSPVPGFAAMSLFGTAYIVASGTFLIQGIHLLPDRPDLGLGIPFLTLAVGQTVGAPLFGSLVEKAGSGSALVAFAMIAGSATVWRGQATPISPRVAPAPPGRAPE
ncbi:MFS transporter [Methylobacterium sp. R2-1]|uniref:MFS transporter n=1 Tax=Methylobacterium sp. R2-1 TaxID=2587064 RepID=UPI001608A637|nr:MFS transporter [Methylobacterium sp. R2-1]MBB2961757.1 putative MFS family arabinose efflux permease [Methylobacterium sp. R2-1]